MLIADEPITFNVKQVQPAAPCSQQQVSCTVFVDSPYRIVTNAVWFIDVIYVTDKFFLFPGHAVSE